MSGLCIVSCGGLSVGVVLGLAAGGVLAAALGPRGAPGAPHSPSDGPRSVDAEVPVDPAVAHAAVDTELRRLSKGLSHDLAGPLRSLASALELIDDDLADGRAADARATMVVVRRQTQQLVNLAVGLVGYCRTAWQPCPRAPVSLRAEVAGAVLDLGWPTGPRLELDLPEEPVVVEEEALRMVLRAALANAYAHHPRPASLRIRVAGAVETDAAGAPWLVLQVHDDGPGIPPEMHEAVFTAFRRSTTSADGAGLGLALAHTLATRFGAHLSVHDSPLGGTAVRVRWPVAPPCVPEADR